MRRSNTKYSESALRATHRLHCETTEKERERERPRERERERERERPRWMANVIINALNVFAF